MFKKISQHLLLIIIIISLLIIFSSHARYALHTSPDKISLHFMYPENPDSIPSFTVDSLYNSLLDKALRLQLTVDSSEEAVFQYRRQAMFMDDTYERIKLQQKVLILEGFIRDIQYKADSIFMLLDKMAEPEQETQRSPILFLDTIIEGIKVYHYDMEEYKKLHGQTIKKETGEEGKVIIIPESDKGDNDFNILPRSPYSPEHPFEDNFQVPSGVFYRVQLAAFSQEIKHDHFGGISPITTQAVDSQKITRYFAGKFAAYTEAESALDKVRSAGFKDAFIVGYYNGQRMSVERIREFEKEHHLR